MFVLYFSLKLYMSAKKVFKRKDKKNKFNGIDCDQKSQLSGILTEPLNIRILLYCIK